MINTGCMKLLSHPTTNYKAIDKRLLIIYQPINLYTELRIESSLVSPMISLHLVCKTSFPSLLFDSLSFIFAKLHLCTYHICTLRTSSCPVILWTRSVSDRRYAERQNTEFHFRWLSSKILPFIVNPYPTAFPYGNGMVLHFYQQQESSTTKTVHKVINKGLKTYV